MDRDTSSGEEKLPGDVQRGGNSDEPQEHVSSQTAHPQQPEKQEQHPVIVENAPIEEEAPTIVAEPIKEEEPTIVAEPIKEEEPTIVAASAKEEAPTIVAEPIKEEEPTIVAEPIKEEAPTVVAEPIKEEEPTIVAEPIKEEAPTIVAEPAKEEEPTIVAERSVEEAPTIVAEPAKEEEPTIVTKAVKMESSGPEPVAVVHTLDTEETEQPAVGENIPVHEQYGGQSEANYPAPGTPPGMGYPAPGMPYPAAPYGTPVPGYPVPGTPYGMPAPGYPAPGVPGTPYPAAPYGTPVAGYPAPGTPGTGYPPAAYGVSGVNYPAYGIPPGYPQPPQQVKREPKQPGRLAHPLPLLAFLGSVALVVVLFILLHLTGSDWAQGALHAAYAALIVAGVLLVWFGVRVLDGLASSLNPTRGRQYTLTAIGLILLVVYSAVFQNIQPNLHQAQAHYLEGQQQWQAAIDEYALSGEKAPNGEDLARVYASWGLALNTTHHYDEAAKKFATVISQFDSSATSDQLKRAQAGNISAQIALGQQSMQAKDYESALLRFDALLNLTYCDDACRKQTNTLDATSYYNVAEINLQNKLYDVAVTTFDAVLTRFASAPEAKQLHDDMAKALLGQGAAVRATTCSSAIPIYQRLVNEYGDTPDGRTAKDALSAPQDVKGTFANPADPTITFSLMGLAQGLKGGITTDDLFNKANASPTTAIQSNGSFLFKGIKQGDYDFVWLGTDGTSVYAEFLYQQVSLQPIYVVHVGPLCPVDAGKISNAHPV